MANDSEEQALPWWRKAIARGVGILAAIVCFICGILTCALIFAPVCIVAGIFMILVSFIIILFEAPICCRCFEKTKKISEWIEQRKYWQKGVIYILISIIPIAMCQGASVIVGFIITVIVGIVYIFMSCRKQDPEPSKTGNTGGGLGEDFSEA